MTVKSIVKRLVNRCGYDVSRRVTTVAHIHALPDLTAEERDICRAVAPFTMTSVERIVALIHATRYVVHNHIGGDIVECGVWRGGSSMVMATVLRRSGSETRQLYLYDTFAGMPEPSERDKRFDGTPASQLLEAGRRTASVTCEAAVDDVLANLRSTGYDEHRIHLIQGKVEDTIPQTAPRRIGLLRLDTDWYESTRHALTHLYPRLVDGGVLILDDYGHWQGAKEAVDEYFGSAPTKPFMNRIDYTGRLVIKACEGTPRHEDQRPSIE